MNSTRTLLIVAATSCIAIGSSAQAGQLLTAEDIVEAVRFRGPDSVMREMIKQNIPVDLLVAGVASGKANWMAATNRSADACHLTAAWPRVPSSWTNPVSAGT